MPESNPFFDSLTSILQSKEYWLNEDNQRQYNNIGVNIGLSQHIDCILHVNEMNRYWQYVNPRMHYDYYFYSIHKMKRKYSKWAKETKDEDIQLVMDYYKVSKHKAEDYLAVLTEENLADIKTRMEKGTIS